MNKLYRVLVFLVFFGLGIPCASAANITSFIPQTVQMDMGSSQEVQIVMDEVPAGLAGFNITISVSDPEIAEITEVSFPDWNLIPENSTVPSSSVWIRGIDLGETVNSNDVNVSLGNITITGKQAGTAGLNIQPELITADGGSTINSVVNPGEINVLDIESDTEFPIINSVDLDDYTPNTGNSILVTVDTTDNVGVSEVKANDVSLVHQSGNIWSGSIVAVEGTHSVNVSSEDAAGNVAWNNDTSYTATTPELPDTEFPVINSVDLDDYTPNTGNSILVTVDTTDNVGVSEVKANDVSLVHQSGNIWSGSIVAVEGTHSVNVSSEDAAGNVAWNNDTSYTATTPELPDTEFPVINSVDLDDYTPNTGNSILVTVDTTDNVGVSEVKANDVSLVHQSGNIWSGSIVAVEGTHSVNVSSEDAAGNVAWNNDTSYTATTPDPTSSEGELQLWTFDAGKVSDIPDNIYTANPINSTSNVSLAYNSTLGSIDSSCWNNDSGETYITGAYPAVNENLTFTIGVDSSSEWSYGYIHTSVANLGIRHALDGSYWVKSYWTSDNGSQLNSSFQIPASSVVKNKVTVSIHSNDSTRTNVVTAGSGMSVTTPYTTEKTRKLPYTNVIQPLIYLDLWANNEGDWVNMHLYNITQSIPRDMITPYARNDIMAFGFDYPNVANNQNGTDLLISRNQTASVYVSEANLLNSDDIDYDNSLFANGFKGCIHFHPGLASESLEDAKNTIDTQTTLMENTLGLTPASWSSTENNDNITHAIYVYNKYGSLYRNGPMGMDFIPNVNTLSNETWDWWSVSSAHGAISPCFTHETDNYPAVQYSIDPDLFKTFVLNLNSNGIDLVDFSKWYYSSMAQTATTDVLQSDENNLKFQLNTSGGYSVNINVRTTISPSSLDCDGVSVPFDQTSDGIQFMSVGNGTYTLKNSMPVRPVANFSTNVSEGYAPLIVQFTDLSTNAESVSWDFENDGVTDTNKSNPVHEFTTAGTYTVNLTASNANGTNSKLGTITVTENPESVLPVANFSTNVSEGYAPLIVQFTDLSTNAESVSWDFENDGVTDTNKSNPVHEFTTAGTYTVNLTASNANGTNSKLGTITVTEKPESVLPVANFTASLTVQFTDISTNNPTQWEWNFGDGTSSTEQNPVHVYGSEGTYTVTLVATNDAGSSYVRSMVITVTRLIPVASFTADPTEGSAPLTVQFTDTSTNSPTQWNWDFGDGNTSTEQNPVHVFSDEGMYSVTLVAINGDGSSDPRSMDIKVNRIPTPPVVNFTAQQTGPLTVQFNDTSSNSPTQWNWDFGDGSTSTDANPAHTYAVAGTYTVNLTVSNADGSDTIGKAITVTGTSASPTARFTLAPQIGRSPLTVKFTDKSVNAASIKWDFGDGTTSTESNPSHTYTTGFYIVRLTATNGDKSSTTANIVIVGR
ncbi:PKD domain-containing protein [Methanosarcina barkeri]|nr:PKD domain-containing protein [Methanosarcina barkeri]